MSQVTHRSPTLSPHSRTSARTQPSQAAWLFEGVIAAGLGLGSLTVLVLFLWIITPYPDTGADTALHVAADLWVLGHGSSLVRTETLSGAPAPVALTPLLLMVLPVWLLHRACVRALSAGEQRLGVPGGTDRPEPGFLAPVGWVAAGYLLTGALAVLFTSAAPVRADVLSAVVRLPLFVLCVAAAATLTGGARSAPNGDGTAPERAAEGAGGAGGATPAGAPGEAAPAGRPRPSYLLETVELVRRLRPLRAALVTLAVLCGGGLLLTAGALLWNLDGVRESFPALAKAWPGRFAVLLLVVALLPNAAVWAASYGLGPGFVLGAGTPVGPFSPGGDPGLPPFPLLAAVPADGAGGILACVLSGAVPLAAGVTAGWLVGRAAVPDGGRRPEAAGWRSTVCAVAVVACCCGAGLAVLAASSGGALGTRALAVFGPSWWLAGSSAAVWATVVGTPTALLVRAWRLRDPGPDDDWHATSARQARWAALKSASGGLMPDFEPRRY
ncbi:hypothetical protein GCM10012287_36890 [Streptomyces daqingensis]|uniref:Integral membrane protein n=1 Tax=Streptomyces daqingensis TaxID=1472640 RepID=A0ABQ2MIH1_9ACTN|nr:DUF6350 family protein [Streptomyces daqingensis]GGO52474.1 hypothetical protein GCM10012287_36890 [Streptomyces daqingensis]